MEASSKEEGRGNYLDACSQGAACDTETCGEVACDEASWAWADTCKDYKKGAPGRDYVCSACPACCYRLWGSWVCHFRKFLYLFIFDRIYSFTSLFPYRVMYRYDSACLIYDLICGFSCLLRQSTHFIFDIDCALLSRIRCLPVPSAVKFVWGMKGGEGEAVVNR